MSLLYMMPLDFLKLWLPKVSLKRCSEAEAHVVIRAGWLRASRAKSDVAVFGLLLIFSTCGITKCPMLRGRCKAFPSYCANLLDISCFKSRSAISFLVCKLVVSELAWYVTAHAEAVLLTGLLTLTSGTGLNSAPRKVQLSTKPAMINMAPRHPYSTIRYSMRGANTKVPSPEPQTAIPVAKERFFSK